MNARMRERPLPSQRRVPVRVLQEQFREVLLAGVMAERQGHGHDANPHASGSDASNAWAAGWYMSRSGRDEL